MSKSVFHTEFINGQKRYSVKQFSDIDEILREDLEDDPVLIEYARTHGFPDIADAFLDLSRMIFRRVLS